MDFDKPEVYGDTSITDGLVLTFVLEHESFFLCSATLWCEAL